MKTKSHSVFFFILLIFICNGCHKKAPVQIIEVKYYNYAVQQPILGPTWESVLNGEHSEYLEKATISEKMVYDSIIDQIKALSPMKKEAVPEDCRTDMQCIVHYPSPQKSDTLLIGDWCISLNKVVMKGNATLVQLIRNHSGYYHPPFKSL
jgi:hypothetical protein